MKPSGVTASNRTSSSATTTSTSENDLCRHPDTRRAATAILGSDARANRAFNFDTRRLTLFVELVNLFGRTNHAPDAPRIARSGQVTGATQRLFPFLPTAGVQIDF